MRTIRLEERDSGHTWAWLAAGAVVGLGVGVLVAERTRGRRSSLRKLLARGRGLASRLSENIGPLLETARGFKDAWAGGEDEDPEAELDDEELDEEGEEDLDDENDQDEDEDDEVDNEDADQDDEDDSEDYAALDSRVLEAFTHDPILAERAIEIEDVGEGDIVLRGRVRNPREVKHAVTMARGVPGVTRVREKLTVLRRR